MYQKWHPICNRGGNEHESAFHCADPKSDLAFCAIDMMILSHRGGNVDQILIQCGCRTSSTLKRYTLVA